MSQREQFGNYLLLKKLGEDPLGESLRAGRIGSSGLEQVVLLRVFNGRGLDGAGFWRAVSGRRGVQQALQSPNVGTGVDLGEVRGIPYVAYDYISGKNLGDLVRQAEKRHHPIPADHALLVTERIALALAVGYETRHGDERLLHGAVVPSLVMISNEGETRLLGYEVAPGVRAAVAAGLGGAELGRYLSPEARSGQPVAKSDDVWSLGAILYELLTGKPVPAGDPGPAIDGAVAEAEGAPLPDDLKKLLKASLTSADRRIADVVSWHKSLSKIMFDGQYSPTTFNLAFYMHNLFRDEIEKESQEIETERTMAIPVAAVAEVRASAAAPAASSAPPARDLREATGVRDSTDVIRDRYEMGSKEGKKGSRAVLIGAIAAVLVLAAAGIGLFLRGRGAAAPAEDTAAATQPLVPEPAAPVAATVPDPEAEAARLAEEQRVAEEAQKRLEEQIEALVAERTKNLEERLAGQYDSQIDALRDQLEEEKTRAQEAETAKKQLPTTPPPAQQAKSPEPAPARPAETAAVPAGTPPVATPDRTAEAGPAAAPPSRPQPAAPAPARPTTPPPSQAAEPTVMTGDLVNLGEPGSVPPSLVSVRQPQYPPQARRMRREATVVVRVLVDENGRVTEAEVLGKQAGFGMDQEAVAAARTARFQPATKDGVRVKMWTQLKFPFKP